MVLPNGQIASPDTALVQTLEAVKDVSSPILMVGASCMKNSGVGGAYRIPEDVF